MSVLMPPTVGILADDMTGALDSAARFTPLAGPIPMEIAAHTPAVGSFSISSNTREAASAAEAADWVAELAPRLAHCDIAFKKVDSLLRGHPFAELAAVMSEAGFERCLFAPAFPEQGRVTIDGRQWIVAPDGQTRPVGPDLITAAKTHGLSAIRASQHLATVADQVIISDAETPADLSDAIRAVKALGGRCLYCGTAGLAGALAHGRPPAAVSPIEPLFVIVGSAHPVSQAQLAALEALPSTTSCGFGTDPAALLTTIGNNRLISFAFSLSTERFEAQERVCTSLRAALKMQSRPAGLVVVGGETLATVADLLSVERILTEGEIASGIPAGRIEGGAWSGVPIFSKSGAFGDDKFLQRILFSEPTPRTST